MTLTGEEDTILGIIHTENIPTWEQLSTTSIWIKIVDYKEVNGAANTDFSFLTESVYNLDKFNIVLLNSKREPIRFPYTERETPQVKFLIEVIIKVC